MSSAHQYGQAMHRVLDEAVFSLQSQLNARQFDVLVCSSATEANHWFFHSVLQGVTGCPRVIMSAIEHPCVSLALERYALDGLIDLKVCRVDAQGVVDLDHMSALVTSDTVLISVILASNEIGTIQPLSAVCELAKSVGALVHSDVVQAVGKLPLDLDALGVDAVSMSAHKCYAPVGCGVLMVKDVSVVRPLFLGGAQQQGLRAGTVNVLGVHLFSLGVAYCYSMRETAVDVHGWAKELCRGSSEVELVVPLSDMVLWNTVSLAVHGQLGHDVMMRLDMAGVMVSTGSACSTGAIDVSPVITALGRSDLDAQSVIRLSFGYPTTQNDLAFVEAQL